MTGYAGQAIAYAEKVQESQTPIVRLKDAMLKAGEDFSDPADQCDVINRHLENAAEALLELGRMILKMDKARQGKAIDEPSSSRSDAANRDGDDQSKR